MVEIKKNKKEFSILALILFILSFIVLNLVNIKHSNIVMNEVIGSNGELGGTDLSIFKNIGNIIGVVSGIIFIIVSYIVYKKIFLKTNLGNGRYTKFNKFYLYNMIGRYVGKIAVKLIQIFTKIGIGSTNIGGLTYFSIIFFILKLMLFLGINLILNSEEEEKTGINIAMFLILIII